MSVRVNLTNTKPIEENISEQDDSNNFEDYFEEAERDKENFFEMIKRKWDEVPAWVKATAGITFCLVTGGIAYLLKKSTDEDIIVERYEPKDGTILQSLTELILIKDGKVYHSDFTVFDDCDPDYVFPEGVDVGDGFILGIYNDESDEITGEIINDEF